MRDIIEADDALSHALLPLLAARLALESGSAARIEEAKEAYRKALRVDDRTQSAHVNLAMLYLREGSLEDASEHHAAAKRLDPRNPQVDELMGAVEQAREGALGG